MLFYRMCHFSSIALVEGRAHSYSTFATGWWNSEESRCRLVGIGSSRFVLPLLTSPTAVQLTGTI